MKLEIEITEEEMKSAIEHKVRVAIADQANQWSTDDYIKKRLKETWNSAIDELIAEVMKDNATLQQKITAEFERKLKAKLTALLRNTEDIA